MLDEGSQRVFRTLRPAMFTLATVGLVMIGQVDGAVARPVRSGPTEPARTFAPSVVASPELPEFFYRPRRITAGVEPAVAPPVENVETAAPPAVEPVPTAAPRPAASAATEPVRPPAATAAPIAAPATARVTAPPVAASCPADWICYPRVGIAGPIVPYTDCSGGTDVGTSIRAFVCLSPTYLLAHAYTQFGKITQWRAGDVVQVYGRTYTVTGAVTQSSCAPPLLPLAPLSLQTSLSAAACGSVLVVQAR